MPDDISTQKTAEAAASPTLAERKSRIIASWVRFAKTICRGHAAFILDTAGDRVSVMFLDGQCDVMQAAHLMATALPTDANFVLLEADAAANHVRGRERAGAIVGLRVSPSKILCLIVPASCIERLDNRRIAALSSVAKLCGSVLAFGTAQATRHEVRARRFGLAGRAGPAIGLGRSPALFRRPAH